MPSISNWPIYTLADAYKPRLSLKFAIHGIFMLPSLNIVYGPPGSLKSMLMADACMSVVTGEPWLPGLTGAAGVNTMQVPTMWFDFDNGSRRSHERFDALGHSRNAPPDSLFSYVSVPFPWLDMTRTSMVMDLIDLVKDRDAHFLVFDNLGVISGNADENTVEMVTVMSNLRLLTERTESSATTIHHQRKSNGTSGRTGDTLRGHSSIEASLDLALLVEREPSSAQITISATKCRGYDVAPMGGMFTYTHRQNSTELETARFFGVEIEDRISDRAIAKAILDAFGAGQTFSQKDLIDEAKPDLDVGINRIRGMIDSLVSAGKLTCTAGIRKAKVYSKP